MTQLLFYTVTQFCSDVYVAPMILNVITAFCNESGENVYMPIPIQYPISIQPPEVYFICLSENMGIYKVYCTSYVLSACFDIGAIDIRTFYSLKKCVKKNIDYIIYVTLI